MIRGALSRQSQAITSDPAKPDVTQSERDVRTVDSGRTRKTTAARRKAYKTAKPPPWDPSQMADLTSSHLI